MRLCKRLHCLRHGHRYFGYAMPKVDNNGCMYLQRICIHCGKLKVLRTGVFLGHWFPMLPGSMKKEERHA